MEGNKTTQSAMDRMHANKVYFYGRYVLFSTEAFVIMAANILTLIAVRRTKKLRQIPANTFIVSLACADGMIGVLLMPSILTVLTNDQNVWMTSSCLFRGPYYAVFSISLATLFAIAVDRYVAVIHPLTYRMRMSTKIARLTCILIWLIQLVLWESMTCYFASLISVSKNHLGAAHDLFPGEVFFYLIQIEILLPILGNVLLYIFIYIRLKHRKMIVSSRNDAETSNENQTSAKSKAFTKMMALVLGYLILAWLPYYVIVPLHKVNDRTAPDWYVYTFDFVAFLLYSNSFVNPIIYSWQNRDFRQAYARILKCKHGILNEEDCTGNTGTRSVTASNI